MVLVSASTLLGQIMDTIKYVLRSKHIDLLLNTRLIKKLNLDYIRYSDESDIYRVLQLAAAQCPVRTRSLKHV